MLISSYSYVYGAGMRINRQIEFHRTEQGCLEAGVKALKNNQWISTGTLKAKQITVELDSTMDKVRAFTEARRTGNPTSLNTKTMDEMTPDQQNNILTQLEPVGRWRLELINNVGGPQGLEVVEEVSIFDPS